MNGYASSIRKASRLETPSEFYYNSEMAFLHFRLKQAIPTANQRTVLPTWQSRVAFWQHTCGPITRKHRHVAKTEPNSIEGGKGEGLLGFQRQEATIRARDCLLVHRLRGEEEPAVRSSRRAVEKRPG